VLLVDGCDDGRINAEAATNGGGAVAALCVA
jgi:hypothetical protein